MPFSRRSLLLSSLAGAATGLLTSTKALAQRLRPAGASGPPPKPESARRQNGRAPVYIAPRFDTGDDRYRWLNGVQAVGKGRFDGRTLTYELCEVR